MNLKKCILSPFHTNIIVTFNHVKIMKATKIIVFLCAITIGITSCNQNEPYSTANSGEEDNNSVLSPLQQKLVGTTWNLIESIDTDTKKPHHVKIFFKDKNTIVFSNLYSDYNPTEVFSGECSWKQESDNDVYINPWPIVNNTNCSDAFVDGACSAIFAGPYTILYITSTEMKMYHYSSQFNRSYTRIYKKISGSSSGGGSTTQGVTDLYLYDYTEWPTKIKVIYKYESDVNVTSAKIYYGEYSASQSVSATVSSSTITATISGLKKNTIYYVKASATTSKGTVYSSESRVMTAVE